MPLGLPVVGDGQYLLDWISRDLGWATGTAIGGASPVPWAEILAFTQALGLELETWEARQLRHMSEAYVEGLTRGRQPMVTSPAYVKTGEEDPGLVLERRLVSEKLGSMLNHSIK